MAFSLQLGSTVLAAGLLALVTAQGDTLGLSSGFLNFSTANFDLELAQEAQVLVSLKAAGGSLDFLPWSYLDVRAGDGQYHWGDVTFRYRHVGEQAWTSGDSSQARRPVTRVTDANSTVLAASNMAATLPANASALSITRRWLDVDGDVGLSFSLENTATTSIELGSLGFPAEFNSIFTNYTAEQAQQYCVLSDPYIGMDAGYIRVSPISGSGAALVVTPLGSTPLEAYRNLVEPYYDSTAYGSQVFEGLYEWQTLTLAWAENEWSAAEPWNKPVSKVLAPQETLTFGLRFSLASGGIQTIDDEVQALGVPYARGIPGFILPVDLPGQLVVHAGAAGAVAHITVDPAAALTVTLDSSTTPDQYTVTPSSAAFGRARLTITYTNGAVQTVHYYLVRSGPDHIAALGAFLTTEQYYTNTSDPFGRAPSVISYDYSVSAPVLQDMRVWIAGLSDEAGAGSFLAASMKQAAQPNTDEIAKLEAFVAEVLYKTLQPPGATAGSTAYAVRKSIFYYGLANYSYSPAIDWTTWESWDQADAYATDRAYDYVHVAATYWALYRAGRAYAGVLTLQDWSWYLNQSYSTVMAAMAQDSAGDWLVGYATDGLMGETVFGALLQDLQREGEAWAAQAAALEAKMRARAALWSEMEDPFGSEMAWDSTGQEGVYYWSKYFGDEATADKTLATVVGFQPTVAHWGWNGNARRYWDFV
ncbi:hypothetical protein BD289DRAFT_418703 [Coniella lustricola]|uniref:Six-hairpin glycosidase-like protein n=1 Tax=Coniella lustricola TaxID=2025994 RepID=A0A2T2ZT76_9PEZI|nr:hypothetical protein BD289DRAFT_418703 [Coniella lustricola]